MIAFAKTPNRKRVAPVRHGAFLKMLPVIRCNAEFAFRFVPAEAREDLIEEVIANAFVAYARVAKAGKAVWSVQRRWLATRSPKSAPVVELAIG